MTYTIQDRFVKGKGKGVYSINAFHGFVVTAWRCYIRYNGEGELRNEFCVGLLDLLGAGFVSYCGFDVVASREECIENMSCDES